MGVVEGCGGWRADTQRNRHGPKRCERCADGRPREPLSLSARPGKSARKCVSCKTPMLGSADCGAKVSRACVRVFGREGGQGGCLFKSKVDLNRHAFIS